MLIQVIARLLLWTTVAAPANAPDSAPTATLWTTAVVHADSSRKCSKGYSLDYSSCKCVPKAPRCVCKPHSKSYYNSYKWRISVQLITTMTHAESTAIVTGTAIGMANQLQVGWQEQIFGCLELIINVMFSPAHSMFLYSIIPHNVFSLYSLNLAAHII